MVFQEELIGSLRANGRRTAIEKGEKNISYTEVLQFADKITQFLLDKEAGREAVIGILVEDRADLICTIIGIVNARCVFVPLDGTLPHNRFVSMVTDLNLECVISSGASFQRFAAGFPSLPHFLLEDIVDTDEDVSAALQYPACDKNDALYVYFTSGSTGKPKGIVGKNCSLLQFIQWEIGAFNLTDAIRVSQLISPYFDAFLRDIFVPLLVGGTICLPPEADDFYSPDKIIPWIDHSRINLIHCVPSVFRIINSEGLAVTNFPALRYVLLSGEKIIPSELAGWYAIFGDRIQLVNLYGPTETTMVRSFYLIRPSDVRQTRIPVGLPIAGTEILIAGKDMRPCDPLVSGEVYIITEYATKGYLNEPGLTQEKFVKQDAATGGERIAFKTGDIARRLANGQIDLIGREDRQIKLRGIRIEPGEIEAILIESGFLKNAVVVHHSENGSESLIAFVIRKEGLPDGMDVESAVQSYTGTRLPKYMIPAYIREMKAFPLLSNGKINYKELLTELEVKVILAAANETESRLLGIWLQIVGNKPISTEDNFHRVGGNSLAIMKLIGLIHKEFNIRVSLQDIFSNMTIKKQAELIQRSDKDAIWKIRETPQKPVYNLSSGQQAILSKYQPKGDADHMTMAWQVTGRPDRDRIAFVVGRLIERHESLRTAFELHDGACFQKIYDEVSIPIEEIACGVRETDRVVSDFIRPFDLGKPPLFRCGVVVTGGDSTTVIFDVHRSVCDAISLRNLYSDFNRLYMNAGVKPLPVQYKDYAEWEHHFRTTAGFLAQREFWLKKFEKDVPSLHLAGDRREEIPNGREMISFSIDSDVINRLTASLKKEELAVCATILTVFFLCLSGWARQQDIVIGVKVSGRMQEELAGLVGLFDKILPLRCLIDKNAPF